MSDDIRQGDEQDETRVAALLRAMKADAPEPDAKILSELRSRSMQVFESAGTSSDLREDSPAPATRQVQENWKIWPGLAALAAAAATIAVVLVVFNQSSVQGAPTFSKVLDNLRSAKSLQLHVMKEGKPAEVWVRAPGSVRWEESPERYRIASGTQLWEVDETANKVTKGNSPWFLNHERQIDLLALLDVGVDDAGPLLKSRPTKTAEFAGHQANVYQVELPAEKGRLQVEAFADAQTNQLLGIIANPAGAVAGAGPPLAELRLVAMNPPLDESKFVVGTSLTDDGRIGKIVDDQGLVVLRPMLAQRWTPISRDTLLKTGDWLRTDIRGANAVKIRLSSEVELTLGPGSLLECISPTKARLHTGQVQYNLTTREESFAFELLGPQKELRKIEGANKLFLHVDREERLVEVKEPPLWLAGFEGTSSNESLGSLIVNLPDGRNEPLSVGYHKVSVEIRDQIARTTIEESFVNHTNGRLEGVFYFPLPQDASISGFGMWIGNDLVEADVVEKQRAREIYETILREKKDPGLLEWTAGNLFKARVFPIEPSAEKRIKIVYTQVLPLRGNKYRYTYGLRSEMLQTKPLRELALSVQVNSALPLKSVSCPTHSARLAQTEHSGQVDFAAQEYTPDRDFEVVCEVESRNADVVVVPHRRGDDGYFLLQLTPPGAEGNWQREVLPEGKPLSLVLLCDTSASMDAEKRKQQAEFVATVLTTLGEKDRFLLAAADVETTWLSPEAMSASAENLAKAREFLDKRRSLGWTNLEQAFQAVLKQAPGDAQIVYVGDGIVTAGESDPAAFVKRLGRLMEETKSEVKAQSKETAAAADSGHAARSFHAVTVGNVYELTVLKGIASVGHGSVRTIGGDRTAQSVALEMLNEIAQPGLRDLKVEFRGVKVAAVYPDQLPSLPAGTQQIIVGRYLPTGKDQEGEVVITGTRNYEPVRFVAKINLKDAEEGNSFIPRLWARSHLDHLLQQGQSEVVKDEIIALSEEFHIITPYTSLLVLESDADRERFGVKRRFLMRDGEKFFAEGRDNANYELLQQQMKRAGDWRLNIRRAILRQLATLGRDPQVLQQQMQMVPVYETKTREICYTIAKPVDQTPPMVTMAPANAELYSYFEAGLTKAGSGTILLNGVNSYSGTTTISGGTSFVTSGPMARGGFGGGGGGWQGEFNQLGDMDDSFGLSLTADQAQLVDGSGLDQPNQPLRSAGEWRDKDTGEGFFEDHGVRLGVKGFAQEEDEYLLSEDRKSLAGNKLSRFDVADAINFEANGKLEWFAEAPMAMPVGGAISGKWAAGHEFRMPISNRRIRSQYNSFGPWYNQPDYTTWIDAIFPPLAPPPSKPESQKDPEDWSAEAIALSKSLLRAESLSKLGGGIELSHSADSFDPRWKRQTGHSSDLVLYSPTAWLTRPTNSDAHTVVNYCNDKERAVFSLALLLGRTRKSIDRDWKEAPLGLGDFSLYPVHDSYRAYKAKVEPAGENQVTLVFTTKDGKNEERLLVDTARHVVLKHESRVDGKLTGTTTYSGFVQIAGSWWATSVVSVDGKDRKVHESTYEIKELASADYKRRMENELAAKPQIQFLQIPGVSLKIARQRVADGSAGFDDRFTMIVYNTLLQQWDELFVHLDAAEKLAADKPGVRWMRTAILGTIRRNDDARKRLIDEAKQLAAKKQQDDLYLADFILGRAGGVTSPGELLDIVKILEPVYDRQPAKANAKQRWDERVLGCYDGLGRTEDAMALRRKLAEANPWDVGRQIDYSRRLLQLGRSKEADEWVQKEMDRPIEWNDSEDEQLRGAIAEFYRTEARWEDLLKYTTEWVKRNPPYQSAYQQHLSALVYNDKLDDANALVEKWLQDARLAALPLAVHVPAEGGEGLKPVGDGQKIPPPERARLEVAISFAQGQCFNLQFQRMNERWYEPLSDAARFFAQRKDYFDICQRIVNYNFWDSDAGDRFRAFVLGLLQNDLEKLGPSQIANFVNWTTSGRFELPEAIGGRKQLDAADIPLATWKKIADQVHARWLKTEDKDEKNQLSEALRSIYAARFDETELLPFLRERVATAAKEYKTSYITALFDTLIGRKWSEENEKEAFGLLPQLTDASEPGDRLAVQVPALYRLVDGMLSRRIERAERELHDAGKVNELTRTELAKKKAEFAKAAKEGLQTRLGEEAAQETGALVPWIRMEKAWLEMQLDQNRDQVEELCWQILGETPPKPKQADDKADDSEAADITIAEIRSAMFDAILHQRAFTTAMNLAARKSAGPTTVKRMMQYIDAGIANGGDAAALWRSMKLQLLVALDKPDDLERELRDWVRTEPSTAPWRKALAYLLAERGRIDEAIKLFEAAEKDQLLTGADYRTLADWYLIANRRDDRERARLEAFKLIPEQYLANTMYRVRERWYRTDLPLPSELDENTLLAFKALFQKSANPEGYLWQLRMIYEACRDFRLLQMLPDGVLGHSPQQIYGLLQNIQGQILNELRNEATADEILARIKKLREGKLTTTDERALDLFESMVERRSSEVLNQPGPHVQACVAAMKRAFDRKWEDGEPRQIASFLAMLGRLPHQPMIDEQLREFRALQVMPAAGSRDHLYITTDLCKMLFWSYGKHDEAINEMQAEVASYEQFHDGRWPIEDDEMLSEYVRMYEGSHRHAAGETVLLERIKNTNNDQQRRWLEDRLDELYNSALQADGEVSLGKGNALLLNIIARANKQLEASTDENVRYNIITRLTHAFDVAHNHNQNRNAEQWPSVNEELKKYAFETIPAVLKRQQGQYRNTVTSPLEIVASALGPEVALRYIVERMEQYPQRLEISWESSWNTFGYELGRRRWEAAEAKKEIGDLAPRVLKLATTELKRELRTGDSRNNGIYWINNQYFWAEKADDFAKAADEVYADRKNFGRNVARIANYFYHGLNRYPHAIEIMLTAYRDGILDESAQQTLVVYLHEQNRHAESIPILEPLVEIRPDNMRYRALLLYAYYRSQRPDQLQRLLAETDKHFHEAGRWNEGNISELGKACLDSALYEKAVGYLGEAISLHQRANSGVINDQTLSNYYQWLADAHSNLGHTKEAVDAASGAIVCWGARTDQRRDALNRLREVIGRAKDLNAYVEYLDAEAAKSGTDSPILRKAIGQVYRNRGDNARAIAQFKLAAQLEPNDKEIYEGLIACYDATGDKAAATEQLVRLIQLDSHDLKRYEQLAERLKDLPGEAERALTSIIEAGPQEAENHAALAEIRQKQNRWDEAIPQWATAAKLRVLEPTNLIKLAEAEVHQKQWDDARRTIRKLQQTEWPARFGDVNGQIRPIEDKLPK